jgi:predicted component of type VI protein secretion system
MKTNMDAPHTRRRSGPRVLSAALLALATCSLLGACGDTEKKATEPERVDVQSLTKDMNERAAGEISADNLDAELEKLEQELSAEEE